MLYLIHVDLGYTRFDGFGCLSDLKIIQNQKYSAKNIYVVYFLS